MNQIQPRFDYKLGSRGPFFAALTFMVSDDHRAVWASICHWPVKTKDGYADLRYKPLTKSWNLKELCASLRSIQRLGDFRHWNQPRPAAPFKNAMVEQALKRDGCTIRRDSLFWDEWDYVALYKGGEFAAFSAAVDVLNALWAEVQTR